MKIRPVGAGLLHPDGWKDERTVRSTDMAKLIVAFHKFANAPKNEDHLIQTSAKSQYHLILQPLVQYNDDLSSRVLLLLKTRNLVSPVMINSELWSKQRKYAQILPIDTNNIDNQLEETIKFCE
jgi:Fe-S-cluster formation regulator IscX/YfhJ